MTLTSTAQHSGSTNMAAVQQRTIPAPSFRPFQPSATAPMNRPTPQSVRPLKPAVAPVASRPIASTPVAAKVPVPTTCSHLHQALATSTILLEHIRTAVKWSRKREHRALKDDQEQKVPPSCFTTSQTAYSKCSDQLVDLFHVLTHTYTRCSLPRMRRRTMLSRFARSYASRTTKASILCVLSRLPCPCLS